MNIFNEKTALILLNMQNDYLHDDGAMARGKLSIVNTRTVTERLIYMTNTFRNAPEHLVISCQFTLIADNQNRPIYPDNIKKKYPFLGRGDFRESSWGHNLIEELRPVNYSVTAIAQSAFYRTHLDWMLKKLEVKNLVFCGVPSNTAVTATVRDAQLNNYNTFILKDGCSDFSTDEHEETMRSLQHLCPVMTCKELAAEMGLLLSTP